MEKYVCSFCGYVYDPTEEVSEQNASAENRFEDLPDDWECPECGTSKDLFERR